MKTETSPFIPRTASWRGRVAACAMAIGIPLLLAACGGGGGRTEFTVAAEQRSIHLGPVSGTLDTTSGTLAWKGIPYAKPPVGALRWAAPQEPEAWTTARTTTAFGPACAQYGRIYGPGANNRYDESIGTTLNQSVGSEDCLYLNVWRPANTDQNLPVIVFFHGGSNVSGYTADPCTTAPTSRRRPTRSW